MVLDEGRVNEKLRVLEKAVDELKGVWKEVRSKVSWKVFLATLTIFSLVILGVVGFQATVLKNIASIDKAAAVLQSNVKHIQRTQEVMQDSIGRVEDLVRGLNKNGN